MIIALDTSQPAAELRLLNDKNGTTIDDYKWQAHRTLARDLLSVLEARLSAQGAGFADITAIVCFKGPGSFTGLRISASVMNTIAHVKRIPIVGTTGDNWVADGFKRLQQGDDDKLVLPAYGREANITEPRK